MQSSENVCAIFNNQKCYHFLDQGVRTTDILDQVKKNYNETEQRISFLEKELAEVPDGTIYDPYTDREVFWEHFGMMENAEYAEKACRKLSYCLNAGLIPGHGLICTFETNHQPISSADIEMLIRTLRVSDQH